jgi:hypothetical protein
MGMEVVVERCGFLDVHRDTAMACARTPDGHGGRREEAREFATTTGELLALSDWLVERHVTLSGWRPPASIGSRSTGCSKRRCPRCG